MDNKFVEMCKKVAEEAAAIEANNAKIAELEQDNRRREAIIAEEREKMTFVVK